MPKGSVEDAQEVMYELEVKLRKRLEEKGDRTFVSSHEMLGIIEEEMLELKLGIIENDPKMLKDELEDIAIACIWSLVSIKK